MAKIIGDESCQSNFDKRSSDFTTVLHSNTLLGEIEFSESE